MKNYLLMFLCFICGCAHNTALEGKLLQTYEHEPSLISESEPLKVLKIQSGVSVQDDSEILPIDAIEIQSYESINAKKFFLNMTDKINFVVDIDDKKKIDVPKYQGSIKQLLKALSRAYGYFYYVMPDGTVIVRDTGTCALKVISQAQEESFTKMLKESFKAENVYYDKTAGNIVFNANKRQMEAISEYIKMIPVSFIEMDLAFLETMVQGNENIGIDLESFKLVLGDMVQKVGSGFALVSDQDGITLNVKSSSINLDAFLYYISKQGKTNIIQRSFLGMVTGSEAILDVSKKIPYVKNVSVMSGETGSALRGYEFDTETSGMTLKVTGVTDTEFVNLKNELKCQDISEYLEVGSGDDLIRRPVVTVRNLTSSVTVRPGAIVKLASFQYEKDSSKESGLPNMISSMKKTEKQKMIITVFGKVNVKKYLYE